MTKHTIKELMTSLDVSRARVYQIIDSLTGDEKISKDNNGRYILDDKAVSNIHAYFDKTSNKDIDKNRKTRRVDETLDDLTKAKRQLDEQSKQIAELKEEIEQYKEKLSDKDEQIKQYTQNIVDFTKKFATLADQAQKLNLADKPSHDEETKEIESPQVRRHWWQFGKD